MIICKCWTNVGILNAKDRKAGIFKAVSSKVRITTQCEKLPIIFLKIVWFSQFEISTFCVMHLLSHLKYKYNFLFNMFNVGKLAENKKEN